MKLIVADSSPLIAFARIGRLDILYSVAGQILLPDTVARECTGDSTKPGAIAILAAIKAQHLTIHADPDASLLGEIPNLDAGETAAIALAKTLKAVVLMDEKLGRVVAKLNHVPVVGSAGILLAAKNKGALERVAPILQAWKSAGYFLSDSLAAEVLRRAAEG